MDSVRRDSAIAMGNDAQSSASQSVTDLALSGGNFDGTDAFRGGNYFRYPAESFLGLPDDHVPHDEIGFFPLANGNHYDVAAHVKSIYDFYVSIGVIEASQMSFGPRNFTHTQHKALKSAGFDDDAIALLKVLPWPSRPINFDWNSPALDWCKVLTYDPSTGQIDPRFGRGVRHLPFCLSQDLKPSEVPLTEFNPGSLGFYWVIDAKTRTLRRIYLTASHPIEEEETWGDEDAADTHADEKSAPKNMDMEDTALEILNEYLTRLERLKTIPVRLWAESAIKPGFVDQSESVWKDVKTKLYDYGWPDTFRREDWLRDLPGLVTEWKIRKVALET